jgi:hypothetical protein
LVVLLGVGVYEADRSGAIRARNATDGWLTAGWLTADAPLLPLGLEREQPQPHFRGIFAADPARDANGALSLRAVRERDLAPSAPLADKVLAEPLSDAERARKEAAYRDYLTNQGLMRLPETVRGPDSGAATSDAVEPSDEPYR